MSYTQQQAPPIAPAGSGQQRNAFIEAIATSFIESPDHQMWVGPPYSPTDLAHITKLAVDNPEKASRQMYELALLYVTEYAADFWSVG